MGKYINLKLYSHQDQETDYTDSFVGKYKLNFDKYWGLIHFETTLSD